MQITFSSEEINYKIKNSRLHKEWIQKVIKKEKCQAGKIQFVFCSDESLLEKNITFLAHQTLTDIITFDYSELGVLNGEIYISVDRVKENAIKFKIKEEEELRRVIIHGVLHLCGYKDKKTLEKRQMREKENDSLLMYLKLLPKKQPKTS